MQSALAAMRAACAPHTPAEAVVHAQQGIAAALASAPRTQLPASLQALAAAVAATPQGHILHGSCVAAALMFVQQRDQAHDTAALVKVAQSPLCRCVAGGVPCRGAPPASAGTRAWRLGRSAGSVVRASRGWRVPR